MQKVSHKRSLAWLIRIENKLHMKLFRIYNFWSALRALFSWPLLLLGLYFASAWIGSMIPVNNDWQQPKSGVDIFIETNGVHVSLILPMSEAGEDLSDLIRPEHLIDRNLYGTHAMIGWGHGPVYRNTATWSDLRIADAASAFFGSDDTLLHVYHLIQPQPSAYRKKIRVNISQYRNIIGQVRRTFRLNAARQSTPSPAYAANNIFYAAHGRYSALHTCNEWTANILSNAGVRIGLWTPMAGGVMRWF
jgi:uncharacterized protein (TIGR02117 family)